MRNEAAERRFGKTTWGHGEFRSARLRAASGVSVVRAELYPFWRIK
jgi:hypothetical protein